MVGIESVVYPFCFFLTFLSIMKIASLLNENHGAVKVVSLFFSLVILLLTPLYLYTNNPIVLKYYLVTVTNYVIGMVVYAFAYFAFIVLKKLKWLKIKQ